MNSKRISKYLKLIKMFKLLEKYYKNSKLNQFNYKKKLFF